MLPLNSAVADYLIQIEQKLVSIDDNQNLQTEVFNKDFGWPKVLQGLQQLSQSLFGLELLAADLRIPYLSDHLQPAQTFQVFENGQAVGELLIDLRWQTSGEDQLDYYVLGRGVRDLQIPRFLIVGKLIQPDAIERLSHDQLINMLHQFGHFLHQQMASEQAWFLNAGLSAEADFIEAPALLFEYWGWSPGGLELFLQTALGEDEISALKAKRDWRQQQITGVLFDFASAVEIQFSSNSSDASLADGSEIRLVDPEIVLSLGHRHCQLDPSHAYRCLLGAEIAAELVSGFEQFGFEDRQTASKLREQILNAGGSRPAIDMLSSFLNRSYSVNY
jgi:Zn-dependent oligopeptidase